MRLRPSITFDQYYSVVQAVRARQGQTKKSQWPGVLTGILIGLVLVVLFEHEPTRESAYVLGGVFLLYFAFGKPYFRSRYRQALRQSFDQQAFILNGNEMEISAAGISGSWVRNEASYNFSWRSFESYIDPPEDFLFLYAPCCWIRVTKDQLTPDDQVILLEWYKAAHA